MTQGNNEYSLLRIVAYAIERFVLNVRYRHNMFIP